MTFSNLVKSMLFAGAFVLGAGAQQGMEVSDFRVPEYDDQGKMTSQIFGERAEIMGESIVKITSLRIELYEDEKVVMTVRSPLCFYDQKKRTATSDEKVFADGERVKVRGRGFFVNAGEKTVRVLNDSEVTVQDLMQQTPGALPDTGKTNGVTVITSKELLLDYSVRKVLFEENVRVKDPEMTLDSGTLELHFGESNEIDWIEALVNVNITREGQEAKAGKAVYDIKTDEFVLEENPSVSDGKNTLYGNVIRFRRNSKQMLCEPGGRLVIYPDKDLKTDFFEN